MTRRKRLCLLLALSACGAQSKLVLATTGMEPTLDLTLPDTITLPDKGRDTVYKSYVDKAYSMALAAALLDMDADTMQTQLAGHLSYDAQTGYIQHYTPPEELPRGERSLRDEREQQNGRCDARGQRPDGVWTVPHLHFL